MVLHSVATAVYQTYECSGFNKYKNSNHILSTQLLLQMTT